MAQTSKKRAPRKTSRRDPIADHALPHAMTDEGLAERAAERRAKGKPEGSGIRVEARDPAEFEERIAANAQAQPDMDRQLKARMAAQEGAIEPWEAPDVNEHLTRKHIKPGFRGRFLSPSTINMRGMRGFAPVKDADGNTVRMGNMILAQMPEERARKRERYYKDKADSELRGVNENFQTAVERASADTDGAIAPISAAETIQGRPIRGVRDTQGNGAELVGERDI